MTERARVDAVPRDGPGERWAGGSFRDFVHSHFSRGKGWRNAPSARSVDIASDGPVAWFDESVENAHFGACRGGGVLRREGDEWLMPSTT